MAFTPVNDGDLAVAVQVQQILDALSGVVGAGQALSFTTLDSATSPALTLQNIGTGGLGLHIYSSSGADLFDVRNSYTDIDNGVLRVDHVNNRVGINNTSPSSTLHVNGTFTVSGVASFGALGATAFTGRVGVPVGTGALPGLYFDTVSDEAGVNSTDGSNLQLTTGGAARLTVTDGATAVANALTLTSPSLGYIDLPLISAPSAPAAGTRLYTRTGGGLYARTAAGAERQVIDTSVLSAQGDLVYASAAGVSARLPISTTGSILWNPGTDVPAWLVRGSAYQSLQINSAGTSPIWAYPNVSYYNALNHGIATANPGAQNTAALEALVVTVCTAGGGTIFFPRGDYAFNANTDINHNIGAGAPKMLWLEGEPGTQFLLQGATGPWFVFGGNANSPLIESGMRHVTFQHAAEPTSGATWVTGNIGVGSFTFDRCKIWRGSYGARIGLQIGTGSLQGGAILKDTKLELTTVGTGSAPVGIVIANSVAGGALLTMYGGGIDGNAGVSHGVRIQNTAAIDTLILRNVSIKDHSIAFYVSGVCTANVDNVFCDELILDVCTDYAILAQPGTGASLTNWQWNGTWMSADTTAVQIDETNGGNIVNWRFNGGETHDCSTSFITIGAGCSDVQVHGMTLGGSLGSGDYGIDVLAASNVAITDNNISAGAAAGAIRLSAAATTLLVADNILVGANIVDLGTASPVRIIRSNTPGSVVTQVEPYEPPTKKNRLINGDMRLAQRAMPTLDDSYCLDRWNLLLESAGAATVSQETSDVPTDGSNRALRLILDGADGKVGIVQFLEFRDCADLRGKTVSLQAKLKASNARVGNVKMAVIEWTGVTPDTLTSDVVNGANWGVEGTNPTLATNWAYLGAPANLSPTTSWATYRVQNLTVGATANNLGVFVWVDDKSTDAADTLRITDVQLEEGSICTQFGRRHVAAELALCGRYYRKSMGMDVSPATASQATPHIVWAASVASGAYYIDVPLDPPMRVAPTAVAFPYTTPANTGRSSNGSGVDYGASSANIPVTYPGQFSIQNSSGGALTITANSLVHVGWTADAEL